jgi:hypothetical protein
MVGAKEPDEILKLVGSEDNGVDIELAEIVAGRFWQCAARI